MARVLPLNALIELQQKCMSEKLRVYFTVDTETSMGGAWRNAGEPLPAALTIFGHIGSRSYGVPLIMDILEEHGFAATFFIEVFCSYLLGFEEIAKVFKCIQDRGHDVQLHLHPVYRFFWDYVNGKPRRERDLLFQLPPEEQECLIGDAIGLYRQFTGASPRAFRAGCYGGSEVTLAALCKNGILIDSSYNLSYLGHSCGFRHAGLNAPHLLEGVHEFPVTNFNSLGGSYRPLEISAVSVTEIISTIRQLQRTECRDVVLVFHSFSFLKRRGVRFEKARPDHLMINRFFKLCSELRRMRDEVEVSVLGRADLSRAVTPQSDFVPSMGRVRPILRKAVQGFNCIPWV